MLNFALVAAGHRSPREMCPTKLSMVFLGFPGWSPGRSCISFASWHPARPRTPVRGYLFILHCHARGLSQGPWDKDVPDHYVTRFRILTIIHLEVCTLATIWISTGWYWLLEAIWTSFWSGSCIRNYRYVLLKGKNLRKEEKNIWKIQKHILKTENSRKINREKRKRGSKGGK